MNQPLETRPLWDPFGEYGDYIWEINFYRDFGYYMVWGNTQPAVNSREFLRQT